MKNVTSRDPRKAKIVAEMKFAAKASKITNLMEIGDEMFVGTALRYEPATGKYVNLGRVIVGDLDFNSMEQQNEK